LILDERLLISGFLIEKSTIGSNQIYISFHKFENFFMTLIVS